MIRWLAGLVLSLFPLLAANAQPADLVNRGRTLFNDTSLSGTGQWSCASCHPQGSRLPDRRSYAVSTRLSVGAICDMRRCLMGLPLRAVVSGPL